MMRFWLIKETNKFLFIGFTFFCLEFVSKILILFLLKTGSNLLCNVVNDKRRYKINISITLSLTNRILEEELAKLIKLILRCDTFHIDCEMLS